MGWAAAKEAGNAAYTKGETAQALASYSEALQDEEVPVTERAILLSNRAQCFLKLGDNASAIEDCTACLTHSPDHVKALFRRASAYEAKNELRDALRDYARAVELAPTLSDAVAGVNRCEVALGIAKPRAQRSGGGGGGGAGAGGLSKGEQKVFQELDDRVRQVALAKMRATEQQRIAASEKRKADLTVSQMTPVPEDRPIYTAVGRMFVRAPKEEVLTAVTAAAAKAEHKVGVCARTLVHLEGQEKEADAAFMEFIEARNAAAKRGAPGAVKAK